MERTQTRLKASMKPIMIIQKLSDAKSVKAQEKIIRDAWESDSEEFFLGVEMSVSDINFNVSSIPEIQDVDNGDPGTFQFKDFNLLATKLAKGEIEGDIAKRAIIDAALKANISEWNLWYRRILLKSLQNTIPMGVIRSVLIQLTTS